MCASSSSVGQAGIGTPPRQSNSLQLIRTEIRQERRTIAPIVRRKTAIDIGEQCRFERRRLLGITNSRDRLPLDDIVFDRFVVDRLDTSTSSSLILDQVWFRLRVSGSPAGVGTVLAPRSPLPQAAASASAGREPCRTGRSRTLDGSSGFGVRDSVDIDCTAQWSVTRSNCLRDHRVIDNLAVRIILGFRSTSAADALLRQRLRLPPPPPLPARSSPPAQQPQRHRLRRST